MADPSDHELTIRLKEPLLHDKPGEAQAERRSSISAEESKILDQARERAVQSGRPQRVVVATPRGQYELFKKELADLGNIEIETPERKNEAGAKYSDQLRIKVTIVYR